MTGFEDVAAGIAARAVRPLGEILAEIRAAYCRYVGFTSQAQSVALALWTAHTHAVEAADVTPYIRVFSAEKESGKTRTEEVAFHLVRGGVRASSVSASALYRLVDARHPTLLVDEVDAIFAPKSDREDLRSILNAGYERGNPVIRNAPRGKEWDPTLYDAFCPKMLAGIENGKLPDTILSRSIPIGLQRKRKGEQSVSKFRKRTDPPRLHELRAALETWATPDVIQALSAAHPESAHGLTDRQDDIWEPLFAIADMAGGDWPALTRAAASELHARDTENESYGVLLLADIRDVLGDDERISTADLAARLVHDGERGPWADWWGREVESGSDASLKSVGHQIARRLKPYGIKTKQLWIDGGKVRGFLAEDLADAFARYLPASGPPPPASPSAGNGRTVDRWSGASPPLADREPRTPSDQAPTVLPFLSAGEGEIGTTGAGPDPKPDLEYACRVVRTERGKGLSDHEIAALLNAQPRSFPRPPDGFAVWTGPAVRVLMDEVPA